MGILANVKYNDNFEHALGQVDKLQKDTAEILAKFAGECERLMTQHNITKSQVYLRCSLVDDIPVFPKLASLCEEIRAVNPRIKFGINNNCAFMRVRIGADTMFTTHVTAMHEVWAYLPEQPYALMRLGYKDYTTTATSSGDMHYGVYSRLIQNRKYNARHEQHCMLMSNDLARAVKNAKSVMRPYAPQEVVQVQLHKFINGVQDETSGVNTEVMVALTNVRQHAGLIRELVHLCQNNYQFLSNELSDLIETYIRAKLQQEEHLSKVRHAWFVTVLTRQDKQHFDVIEMFDVHKMRPTMHDPKTYTAETLPEEIAGKMAVLSMIDVGTRVSDVGMRATETTFYVERV